MRDMAVFIVNRICIYDLYFSQKTHSIFENHHKTGKRDARYLIYLDFEK